MEAVTNSVAMVAEENGQDAANDYVAYFNSAVLPAILSPTDKSAATDGVLEFTGWRLEKDYVTPYPSLHKYSGNLVDIQA